MIKTINKVTYARKTPAKINIGLRVLSKRKDGYHNLETIFYPVKIYDEVKVIIEKLPDSIKNNIIKVNTQPQSNISGNKNICYKVVELFMNEFGIEEKYSITINIRKKIPIGAGLGGGSSDAVCVLMILLKYFKIKWKPNETLPSSLYGVKAWHFAQDIGSDVPFFLLGKPAYAEKKGEKLTPLPKFRVKGKILLVNPGIHISTPWAFKELGIKGKKKKLLNKIHKFDLNDQRIMINDFERVVFKKYPQIEKIKYDMYSMGANFSLMSGSGSTVYGIFNNARIKTAGKYFRAKKYKVFVS